ncbi:sulfite reductase, assimilatory-type [Pseudodesulfovibrio nedwellii]|uniref:Sulfite reductase, assimilatory-type n=1 Tax=Pseudodesulfovibrio nedwellii TaxID=2973072 RepID=A0ABM8B4F8_9BACT|nr:MULTISPECIES: nitrite reductase [Pseudodesulfovibrio]BDQ38728.1 sulfite reductase, assimilatory-type [Pseudodesulfovibrio nedwellii]
MTSIVSEPVTVMPIERKDGTYALRLCLNQGLLTPGMTRSVMEIMETYPGVTLRATTGQRMNLEGVPKGKLDEIVSTLGVSIPKCPPGVSVCPGGELCKYGQQNTREMGDRLLEVVKANGPYPFKVKSGVSGCGMACSLSFVRDIGLVGIAKGWNVIYGGSARHRAAPGLRLAKGVSDDEALAIIAKALVYYRDTAKKGERIGMMVRRLGHDVVADALK